MVRSGRRWRVRPVGRSLGQLCVRLLEGVDEEPEPFRGRGVERLTRGGQANRVVRATPPDSTSEQRPSGSAASQQPARVARVWDVKSGPTTTNTAASRREARVCGSSAGDFARAWNGGPVTGAEHCCPLRRSPIFRTMCGIANYELRSKDKLQPGARQWNWPVQFRFSLGLFTLLAGGVPAHRDRRGHRAVHRERLQAGELAHLAKDMGAKCTVLTARHHDGFALWPSSHPNAFHAGQAPMQRDLIGECVTAVRNAGLRVGLHYSPMSWRYLATTTSPAPTARPTSAVTHRSRVQGERADHEEQGVPTGQGADDAVRQGR